MPVTTEKDVNTLALEKGMPENPEAEQFVLGSVLLDDSLFPQVAGELNAEDFKNERHRRIFHRMCQLGERGERIEYITLSNELEKHKQLEQVGGITYISALTEGMPRFQSIESYIKIVKNKSLLRQLINTSQTIIANCIDENDEADTILANSESAIMHLGNQTLRTGLENPIETLSKYEGGMETFLDPSKRAHGLETPFHRFTEMTNGFLGGQLIVIAGRPAMGKTAIALNIAAHVAMPSHDRPTRTVAIFSLEMSKDALLTRILCSEANVDQHRFRGGFLKQEEKKRLSEALARLVQSQLFIDDSAGTHLMEISAKSRRLKSEHGLDLIIVDYLQLLGSKGKVENRVQEISALSRGLKLLAKDLDLPIIALSQLSRRPETRDIKDRRPILSDLRESGSIEQDADIVCFIYRGEVYQPDRADLSGKGELIIAKQRNGPTGKVNLAFLHEYAKFASLSEREDESF